MKRKTKYNRVISGIQDLELKPITKRTSTFIRACNQYIIILILYFIKRDLVHGDRNYSEKKCFNFIFLFKTGIAKEPTSK